MRSEKLWKLEKGKWTFETMTSTGIRIEEITKFGEVALPGEEHPFFECWARREIALLVERVCPAAIVYAAPEFAGQDYAGMAYRDPHVILLRSSYAETEVMRTLAHECWHLIEQHLTLAELSAVDAAVDRGIVYGSDYSAQHAERRARAFEAWSIARMEAPGASSAGKSGQLVGWVHRWTMPAHERVFDDVLSGRVAMRTVRSTWLPSSRFSAAVRKRAAGVAEELAEQRQRLAWKVTSYSSVAASMLFIGGRHFGLV